MRSTPSVIIDRSEIFREGLAHVLTTRFSPVLAAVAEVSAVPISVARERSLIFVLSCEGDAGASVSVLRQSYPATRILVLSTHCDANDMCQAMQVGANGYLPKTVSPQVLLKALDLLLDDVPIAPVGLLRAFAMQMGDMHSIPKMIAPVAFAPPRPDEVEPGAPDLYAESALPRSLGPIAKCHNLSEQEMRVTLLLARGCTNKAVAIHLDITEATVKAHVKAILRKIRVRNRTQAALWAIEHGLTALDPAPISRSGHPSAISSPPLMR